MAYDEAVGSVVNTLQLATHAHTQRGSSKHRNSREVTPLPLIAAETPFLHSQLSPLHITAVRRKEGGGASSSSNSNANIAGAGISAGDIGSSSSDGAGWEVTLSSMFAPAAAGALAHELQLLIEAEAGIASNKEEAVLAQKYMDRDLYARVAQLRNKASSTKLRYVCLYIVSLSTCFCISLSFSFSLFPVLSILIPAHLLFV